LFPLTFGVCVAGFYFLFRDVQSSNVDVQKFSTLIDTILNLFQMTLGEFKVSAAFLILTFSFQFCGYNLCICKAHIFIMPMRAVKWLSSYA
jgi:hypothetical protein